jgi:cytochrome c peroxidase
MKIKGMICLSILALNVNPFMAAQSNELTELGKQLFFDTTLSEPAGQACASCHLPTAGFADPDRELPVSRGVHPDRFGDRNTPSIAYSMFTPTLNYDEEEQHYVGGLFHDGRAATLEEQAKQPFLNVVEMANPDKESVVRKVRAAPYAQQFDKVFGKDILKDADKAFNSIAKALAAFERTEVFRPFSSKYDYFLAGKVELTAQEARGLELFEAEDKGNCVACHPSKLGSKGEPPLFTDYTYDNIGLPVNQANPFYFQSKRFNPKGDQYVDIGLAKTTGRSEDLGKFKVPTLRNVALTPPYLHNGIFSGLKEVVDFYNTRDTRDDWGTPEVSENVNTEELGDLGLSDEEVDAIVAFMGTLTDGYDINQKSAGEK